MNWDFIWAWLFTNGPVIFTGLIVPVVVLILNKDTVGSTARFVVTLFACLVGGVLLHLGELSVVNLDQVLSSAVIVFTESQLVYRLYFAESKLRTKLETMMAIAKPS